MIHASIYFNTVRVVLHYAQLHALHASQGVIISLRFFFVTRRPETLHDTCTQYSRHFLTFRLNNKSRKKTKQETHCLGA